MVERVRRLQLGNIHELNALLEGGVLHLRIRDVKCADPRDVCAQYGGGFQGAVVLGNQNGERRVEPANHLDLFAEDIGIDVGRGKNHLQLGNNVASPLETQLA